MDATPSGLKTFWGTQPKVGVPHPSGSDVNPGLMDGIPLGFKIGGGYFTRYSVTSTALIPDLVIMVIFEASAEILTCQ